MARISMTNGHTVQTVDSLTPGQVLTACEVASVRDGAALEAAEQAGATTHAEWLEAYCDACEAIYGEVFAVG